MTTNSQLLTNEPKRKENNKNLANNQNRNRIREMDITQREFSGDGEGRNREEKVQGRRSIISRHKIDGERLKKWYRKQRTQRNYMYNPWALIICITHGGRMLEDWRGRVEEG